MNVKRVAAEATVAALRLRTELGQPMEWPISPYGVAERCGIAIHFVPAPSLEGMYSPDGPRIILGSLRPRGRRAFTCGHELGHHVFGHGLRVDHQDLNLADVENDDEAEYSANRFSAALLMPKIAVDHAFSSRNWSAASCTSAQAYVVAGCLGVGYTTLLVQMQRTLRIVSAQKAQELQVPLPRLRRQIVGFEPPHDLIVVDELWRGRDVEAEVGDLLLLPKGAIFDGAALEKQPHRESLLVRAVAPGHATARTPRWSVRIGVSKRHYAGLNRCRHWEDPEHVG